jgi:hypothetical protein
MKWGLYTYAVHTSVRVGLVVILQLSCRLMYGEDKFLRLYISTHLDVLWIVDTSYIHNRQETRERDSIGRGS